MPDGRVLGAQQVRERLARSASTTGAAGPYETLRANDDRSDAPPARDTQAVTPERVRLRAAVVLLDAFHGNALTTIEPDSRAIALFVAQDCERVTSHGGGAWRLRISVRRAVIATLGGARELLATRAVLAGDPDDLVAEMAVAILRGEPGLEHRSPPELASMLTALDWLRDTTHPRPTVEEVTAALDRAGVLAPMRAVTSEPFVGRTTELAWLEQFLVGRDGPLPLLLHGPGGVGKSTLLARFVLDHVDHPPAPGAATLTFAYLTFDRPDLSPERPLSLLGEACRQLRGQDPQLGAELDTLEQSIAAAVRLEMTSTAEASPSRTSSSHGAQRDQRAERALVERFAAVVRDSLARRGGGLLWVLDTFEQAQRHGPTAVERLDRFLDLLRSACPELRVVIAGRAEEAELASTPVPLPGFDDPGAVAFLQAQLLPAVVEADLLQRVVRVTRGNPLSLRLAADLIRRTGPGELQSAIGQQTLLRELEPELLQGMLYRRVLDHISRPEIRALANPGLVVRRITPAIISTVLAGPCGLGPVDDERAQHLFRGLRREVSLVYAEGPDVLIHRADVRAEMLPLLVLHDPHQVEAIHRAAVEFYAVRSSVRERAEEIYHRLMLGQSSVELDARWDPGAAPWLQNALDELPAPSRTYLAHRLDVQVGSAGLAEADQLAWTRKVAQEVRVLLDAGRPVDALGLLDTRTGTELDPGLLPLRVEACASAGRLDQALDWLARGLDRAEGEGELTDLVALAILGARIFEDAGRFDEARTLGQRASLAAETIGVRLLRTSAAVALTRIDRRSGQQSTPEAQVRHRILVTLAASLSAYERASNPALLRELAAEVGQELPELLREAAVVAGIELLDPEPDAGDFAPLPPSAISPPTMLPSAARPAAPSARRPGIRGRLLDLLDRAMPQTRVGISPEAPPSAPGHYLDVTPSSWETGSTIGEYLATSPGDDEAVKVVSEYFQSEVDASSYDYQDDRDGSGA